MLHNLKSVLTQFLDEHDDLKGAAIFKADGTSLISVLPSDTNEDETSVISANLLSLAEKVADTVVHGHVESIIVRCDTGYGVLTSCNPDMIMLILTQAEEIERLPLSPIKRIGEMVAAQVAELAV